jgi:ubiquinone/menaquinone biosynthesis C-methylase UbiE
MQYGFRHKGVLLMDGQKGPQYLNWISYRAVGTGAIITLALLFAARFTVKQSHLTAALLLIAMAIALVITFVMARARTALSYTGGGVQRMVLEDIISRLKKSGWSGRGKVIDIGCGSGAMPIMLAKKYPHVRAVGVDTWQKGEYSQALCEHNAELEGAKARTEFRKGNAKSLPYMDGVFDAAVSNLVFSEVKQSDKAALMREALRVVKPGGYFAFCDTFYDEKKFGPVEELKDTLKDYAYGIHFVDMRNPDYAPGFLKKYYKIGKMGIIYGRKKENSND